MRLTALVQARLGSKRFPRKVTADIMGRSMLYRVCERLQGAGAIDEVVVIAPGGDHVELEAYVPEGARVIAFQGLPEENLAARHMEAALYLKAGAFVRVPSDNPCVDPAEVDRAVGKYENSRDAGRMVTNYPFERNQYPDGVGCEVWPIELIMEVAEKGSPRELEHPHAYPRRYGRVLTIKAPKGLRDPDLRCDVNTEQDLEFVREVYRDLGPYFNTAELVRWVGDMEER